LKADTDVVLAASKEDGYFLSLTSFQDG